MDKKEIERLVREEGLTITDLIDVVIDINHLIGVGIIDLQDHITAYFETTRKQRAGNKHETKNTNG